MLFVSSALTRAARVLTSTTQTSASARDKSILRGCSTAFMLSPSPYLPYHPPPSVFRHSAQICVREVSRPCNPCGTARCSNVVSEGACYKISWMFVVNHVYVPTALAGVLLRLPRSGSKPPGLPLRWSRSVTEEHFLKLE